MLINVSIPLDLKAALIKMFFFRKIGKFNLASSEMPKSSNPRWFKYYFIPHTNESIYQSC